MTAHATHEVFAAVGISDYFELRTGVRFRIPSWAIRTLKSSTSSNRDEGTPMTLQFMWSNHELRQGKRGRIMFVPGDLEPNTELEVVWVEKHSACAKRPAS